LTLQKGDLVVLQQESSDAYSTGWCFGENDRTGKKGDFPAECVYLLPTMNKPPIEILVINFFFFYLNNFNKSNICFNSNFLHYNQWKKQMK
jgi:myosin-7